jgi:hypothetical protein
VGRAWGRVEGLPHGGEQRRLVGLHGEQEVGAAGAHRRGHGRRGAGRVDGDEPPGQIQIRHQVLDGRPFSAGAGLDQADHPVTAQSLPEMMDRVAAPGAAQPLGVDVHGLALGHDRVEEVLQGVGLRGPAQRVGAGWRLPDSEMPAKQVVVRLGPVGGRVSAAASRDPRQQQDHQQTEQGMFDRPASIVPELSKSSADVHKHASSLTLLKLVGDETWLLSCAVCNTCRIN